ncbi:hypothetical protein E1A91_D11G360800v1 [Gossypium mustelinum]|uniref:non-specific serine/threonine protein kinase n=1 Tax=Gossypium mustelinum TaxID=34275 RepID=A0A5D2T1F0_GOSMU|nr:hypothetical protein E1A91_D11G360800v1 [Gossypium mustelinum]
MSCLIMLVLLLFLLNLASSDINEGQFSFYRLLKLTNSTSLITGHIFHEIPIQFKNSKNGTVFSFSTTFIFTIRPEHGHGMAFVISPKKEIPAASAVQYLGLFNETNNGDSSNHIVAVELDTVKSLNVNDTDDNHVGIDINSVNSVKSASAGYYTDEGEFINVRLVNGDPMQIWIEYNGVEKRLNVTLYPIDLPRPKTPLISYKKDLSPYMYDSMYVGFSSSTGSVSATSSSHYLLAWSFKMNGSADELDLSRLPKIPRHDNGGIKQLKKILAITLSFTGLTLVLVLVFGFVLISRKKRFMEILEDWEGFKKKEVLGRGGFGRVYKGVLPSSNIQIAVKRISHDSRQGMREFVAQIATIGRLRHPNLVRLLGYCKRRHELLLVYDYMPNGSLDKFLYYQPNSILNWTQRFKIIKDVASALFYLHQQWVQVIIHRDIKPANVLIDGEMNARLGDFGMAKLCDLGNDPQTSHVAGTLGYMAPELARTGKANTSTDIYAFGIFMLEVACGRKPIEPQTAPEEAFLADWIKDCWDKGDILATIDKRLGKRFVGQQAELVLKLGLLCSHPVTGARPSMSSVISYLDGVASLPDDFSSVIKVREFPAVSNDVGAPNELTAARNTVPSITITEAFVSHGR